MLFCEAINASNERIYLSAIFVVHLGVLPTLGQSVTFINKEDYSTV